MAEARTATLVARAREPPAETAAKLEARLAPEPPAVVAVVPAARSLAVRAVAGMPATTRPATAIKRVPGRHRANARHSLRMQRSYPRRSIATWSTANRAPLPTHRCTAKS